MRFPAKFTPAKEGGFVVTFPDIPEAITQGDNVEDALALMQQTRWSRRWISISRKGGVFPRLRAPSVASE